MTSKAEKTRSRTWPRLLLLLFIAIIMILCYYQLFYKSPGVEGKLVKPEWVFTAHKSRVTGVRFSPDGLIIASGSVDGTVTLWKKETGGIIRILKQPQGVSYLDYSADGNHIATGSYDGVVRLWRVIDGALLKEFRGHEKTVWCVAFSPDGKSIASGGDDALVYVWDIASGKNIRALKGHNRIVWAVKFSPDNTMIASASFDNTIKLWNVSNGSLLESIDQHTEAVVDIAFSNSGKMLASTSDDKTIKLWSLPEVKLIRTMEVPEHVQAVVFSPDDKRLVTGGRDKPMIGEFLQEVFGDSDFNRGVSMRLWDVESGALLQTFTEHRNDVNDIAYSKDGLWIASASEDNTVRLWRITQ